MTPQQSVGDCGALPPGLSSNHAKLTGCCGCCGEPKEPCACDREAMRTARAEELEELRAYCEESRDLAEHALGTLSPVRDLLELAHRMVLRQIEEER